MVKNVKLNYIYNVIYQIVNMLAPIVTVPYISRVLGAEGVGEYSYATSIVQIFALFSVFGISIYGQREVSYCQDDLERRSIVFWNAKLFQLFCTSIVLSIYLCYSFFQIDSLLFFVLSLNIIFCAVDISWLLQGMEDFGILTIRNLIVKILGIILIFVFVRTKDDLVLYAFILGITGVIGNISIWFYSGKYLKKICICKIKPFSNFKIIFSLFVPCFAMEIYSVFDKTMIGMLCNDSFENGYYEQASKISRLALIFVTSLGIVLVPRMGYFFDKGNKELFIKYIRNSCRFVWFLALPLSSGIILTSGKFIPLFLGDGFYPVIPIVSILSLLIIIIGLNNITGMQILIPIKSQNLFTFSVSVGAFCNLVMNFFFIKQFGALGASISSVISELIVLIIQLVAIRKIINISFFFICGWKNLLATAIMSYGVYFVQKCLSCSIVDIILIILSGIILYLTSLLVLRDYFLYKCIKTLFRYL